MPSGLAEKANAADSTAFRRCPKSGSQALPSVGCHTPVLHGMVQRFNLATLISVTLVNTPTAWGIVNALSIAVWL